MEGTIKFPLFGVKRKSERKEKVQGYSPFPNPQYSLPPKVGVIVKGTTKDNLQ